MFWCQRFVPKTYSGLLGVCKFNLISVKQNIAECGDHWRPTLEDLVGDWGPELHFIGLLPSVLSRCKICVLGAGSGCRKRGASLKHLCCTDSINQGCDLDILTKLLCRFLSNASQCFQAVSKYDEDETLLICIPDLNTVCWGWIKDNWTVNYLAKQASGDGSHLWMAHPQPVYWFHFCFD